MIADLLDWAAKHSQEAKDLASALKDGLLALGALLGLWMLVTATKSARAALLSADAATRSALAASEQARIANDGKITDRLAKAVEQLGSTNEQVRLGALFALERVAQDSFRDHPIVMEHIARFVRHVRLKTSDPLSATVSADVELAVSVIGRRNNLYDKDEINLSECSLLGFRFRNMNFRNINFFNSDLSASTFYRCNLSNANLIKTNLTKCTFDKSEACGSNFHGSTINGVNFTDCNLNFSNFVKSKISGSTIKHCNLEKSELSNVQISNSTIKDSNINRSIFRSMRVEDVKFINLFAHGCSVADLRQKNFELNNCDFSFATFISSDLSGVRMRNFFFRGGVFKKTNLSRAKMNNAKMEKSLLVECKLNDAILNGSRVRGFHFYDNKTAGISIDKIKGLPFRLKFRRFRTGTI